MTAVEGIVEGVVEGPEARCPVARCDAELYLTLLACIPLYAVNPPWPGAGEATYGPSDAVSDGWEVMCTNDHRVWTHVDQIRADNAAGLTDDDETGDSAPTFKIDLLLEQLTLTPLSSRRRADAGRPSSSTRASETAAGQGTPT